MPRIGGYKPGAGRPRGAVSILSKASILAAQESGDGLLPHQFLLNVMRNINFPMDVRIDAAKAAAPYYAPRLAQIEAKIDGEVVATISTTVLSPDEWENKYINGPVVEVDSLVTASGTTESTN